MTMTVCNFACGRVLAVMRSTDNVSMKTGGYMVLLCWVDNYSTVSLSVPDAWGHLSQWQKTFSHRPCSSSFDKIQSATWSWRLNDLKVVKDRQIHNHFTKCRFISTCVGGSNGVISGFAKSKMASQPSSWKIQMAISPRWIIWLTLCLVPGWGFRCRRIE